MAKISRVQWDKTPFFSGGKRILSRLLVLENSLNFCRSRCRNNRCRPKVRNYFRVFLERSSTTTIIKTNRCYSLDAALGQRKRNHRIIYCLLVASPRVFSTFSSTAGSIDMNTVLCVDDLLDDRPVETGLNAY